MAEPKNLTTLKLWSLYLIPEDSKEMFFINRSYWKIRMVELQNRHALIDKRAGVNNTYKIILESSDGYVVDEADL